MPITWSVDHSTRVIVARLSGSITSQDFADYLAGIAADGAAGYRVILNMRSASLDLRSHDITALGQQTRARTRAQVSDGRIAFVIESDAEWEMTAYFIEQVASHRDCRRFKRIEDAMAWFGLPPG